MKIIRINAGGKPEVIELEKIDYIKTKELIGITSPVDCAERKIGDKFFDFWLDDEGLLKDEKIVSGILYDETRRREILVGNLLILNHES